MRLFFALWPNTAYRKALATAAAGAVARVECHPVPPANLHVTLAFLGSVPADKLGRLIEAGGLGDSPAIELPFDRLEYWPKPRVLVALASRVAPECAQLVDRLWRRLEPLGFSRDRRPWQPHLTLARHVRHPPPEDLAIAALPARVPDASPPWRLALVESVTGAQGARYRPLADWPLG